jgi:hypothetical protein
VHGHGKLKCGPDAAALIENWHFKQWNGHQMALIDLETARLKKEIDDLRANLNELSLEVHKMVFSLQSQINDIATVTRTPLDETLTTLFPHEDGKFQP